MEDENADKDSAGPDIAGCGEVTFTFVIAAASCQAQVGNCHIDHYSSGRNIVDESTINPADISVTQKFSGHEDFYGDVSQAAEQEQ